MYKLLLLLALVPAVMMQRADHIRDVHENWTQVPVRPCTGSERPAPRAVRLEHCPSLPCHLRRGHDANMVMDFTNNHAASNLNTHVEATALGVTGPYNLPDDRAAACNWMVDARCPLSVGEDLIYHLSMPVTAIYPLVSVAIEIELRSDAGVHACFVIDAVVTAN
ncbi:NPC intracellular cholesterol transporter 2-like [Uranotaenia lowii]|uniref:NPC intracellular cholesterol transporter 2-like n=1 Tax=Uranotaenia lowii TaxID=190385 RepID=UPI002478DA61|nr:NPC intracellular cholesterol transporter 2-like [Uranotaenia lowii]